MKVLNNILLDIHPSWRDILKRALLSLDGEYLKFLLNSNKYFPDINTFLNPFKSMDIDSVNYILFGQDPYPRQESAIGYAFIDAKVKYIFSDRGFSKEVNRATSLRNFIKMLLLCEGFLKIDDMSQKAISGINKANLCKNIIELKNKFEKNGVLLLNMALIFTDKSDSKYHLKKWKPFVQSILCSLKYRNIKLILFGNAAKEIEKLECNSNFEKFFFAHPYNISFIQDKEVHKLFKSMNLMKK